MSQKFNIVNFFLTGTENDWSQLTKFWYLIKRAVNKLSENKGGFRIRGLGLGKKNLDPDKGEKAPDPDTQHWFLALPIKIIFRLRVKYDIMSSIAYICCQVYHILIKECLCSVILPLFFLASMLFF